MEISGLGGLSLTCAPAPVEHGGDRSLMLRTNNAASGKTRGAGRGGVAKGRAATFKRGFGGPQLVKPRGAQGPKGAGRGGARGGALVQPRQPQLQPQPQPQQPQLQQQQQQQQQQQRPAGLGLLVGGTPPAVPMGPPKRCSRAKVWTPEVENCFRVQNAGWREVSEYIAQYGEPPTLWPNGFYRCVRVKDNGFFTYWSDKRECEDKHVPRIKVFEY